MTNHPNRGRYSIEQIRQYLADRYDAEIGQVLRGVEADEEAAGLYHGKEDAWIVYGRMPNSIETGWFFAGYNADIVRDMRAEDR